MDPCLCDECAYGGMGQAYFSLPELSQGLNSTSRARHFSAFMHNGTVVRSEALVIISHIGGGFEGRCDPAVGLSFSDGQLFL